MSEQAVPPRVVLDANALLPISLCDTLLRTAHEGLYEVLWNATILDEVERNLVRLNWALPSSARRRCAAMRGAFPTATVTGYESLLPAMANDAKDRHVLATAVHAGAQIIVTQHLRHFPRHVLAPHGIEALSADTFLRLLLAQHPDVMRRIITKQAADLRDPPLTALQILNHLATEAPTFVRAITPLFEETNEGE